MRDPLVSTDWLAERLVDPRVRPVDASWWFSHEHRDAHAEFEAAHIPGAVFFDIDAIADRTTDLPHMLPPPAEFATAVGALGLGDDTIVVYESGAPRSAARAWWSFRAMGHEQVFVLDGGLPKWRREGRSVAAGPVRSEPAAFTPRFNAALVKTAAQVRTVLDDGGEQVVDARPAPRFRGEAPEPRQGLKLGHMPGARNLAMSVLYESDGTLLPAEVLTRRFGEAGIDPAKPLIATCGSGITACSIALALARLGQWEASVYDGSWAEWGATPQAPTATGA